MRGFAEKEKENEKYCTLLFQNDSNARKKMLLFRASPKPMRFFRCWKETVWRFFFLFFSFFTSALVEKTLSNVKKAFPRYCICILDFHKRKNVKYRSYRENNQTFPALILQKSFDKANVFFIL